MSVRKAHDATLEFLSKSAVLTAPIEYHFSVLDIDSVPRDPALETRLRARFSDGEVFGSSRAEEAIALLEEISPQSASHGVPAIWLSVRASFQLLDPKTGLLLPGQDPNRFGGKEFDFDLPLGASRLKLSLHNTAALALDMSLPDLDDEQLAAVARGLQANLPFKLSPKQWKRWTPTRTGTFVGRKIGAPGT